MHITKNISRNLPWVLFVIVLFIPAIAWMQNLGWQPARITAFSLFPLLGIWAWSIMWTHYAYGAIRLKNPQFRENILYSKLSGYIVLLLLLAHPGILAWEQKKRLGILPPGSFFSYVANSMRIFIVLGTIGLVIFLSYEFFDRLQEKTWVQKNRRWISLSQMIAMGLIFIHGLGIGQNINSGWLELYWIMLGLLLFFCFLVIGKADWKREPTST
ncbi:hypothetical protein BH23PAT2_BH23PAT2_09690 [soil metagenome]